MAINFTGLSNQSSVTKNERTTKDDTARSSVDNQAVSPSGSMAQDTVRLSGTAQTLKNQEANINNMSDIDQDKVNRIRSELASGSYQVDSQKLAGNMTSMDSLF